LLHHALTLVPLRLHNAQQGFNAVPSALPLFVWRLLLVAVLVVSRAFHVYPILLGLEWFAFHHAAVQLQHLVTLDLNVIPRLVSASLLPARTHATRAAHAFALMP
jgi:hypothetical protein